MPDFTLWNEVQRLQRMVAALETGTAKTKEELLMLTARVALMETELALLKAGAPKRGILSLARREA